GADGHVAGAAEGADDEVVGVVGDEHHDGGPNPGAVEERDAGCRGLGAADRHGAGGGGHGGDLAHAAGDHAGTLRSRQRTDIEPAADIGIVRASTMNRPEVRDPGASATITWSTSRWGTGMLTKLTCSVRP